MYNISDVFPITGGYFCLTKPRDRVQKGKRSFSENFSAAAFNFFHSDIATSRSVTCYSQMQQEVGE